MNRLDRLQAILIQLQSKRVVRAQEIADRFEISLRTVYRDIRSLEESGVPIGAEAGVGYYLMDNYSLPPVMFTHEEASALLFGEKLVDNLSDKKVKADFDSAIFKIKAILKPTERDHLEKLHDRIAVFSYTSTQSNSNPYLYEIQQALANKQVISIAYESGLEGDKTERKVNPIGLCNYASRWHLIAWCQLRNSYRDFRLDRIRQLSIANQHFDDKQFMSLDEYLKTQNSLQGETNIAITVSNQRRQLLDSTKHWYGFVDEQNHDDKVRMEFINSELNGFAIWLLNSGCHAYIEKPDELRAKVKELIDSTNKSYNYLL